MNVTLKQETEDRVAEAVRRGDFRSVDEVVEQALTFFLDYHEGETDDEESLDIQAAVEEGFQQAERGEGMSLSEFAGRMRIKHGSHR